MIALFSPGGPLIYITTLVIAFDCLLSCINIFIFDLNTLRLIEVSTLMNTNLLKLSREQQLEFWGVWLYDAFWAQPAQPDISLII